MVEQPNLEQNLLEAVMANDIATVDLLLEKGANPNCADSVGYSPIIIASIFNYPEIVERLLMHGASKKQEDFSGWNAQTHAEFNLSYDAKKSLSRKIKPLEKVL